MGPLLAERAVLTKRIIKRSVGPPGLRRTPYDRASAGREELHRRRRGAAHRVEIQWAAAARDRLYHVLNFVVASGSARYARCGAR